MNSIGERKSKIDIDPDGLLPVTQIDIREELKRLFAPLVTARVQQQGQQLRIPAIREFGRVKREIDIDAFHMLLGGVMEEQIRHPTSHDNHAFLERRQHLSQIDEHAVRRSGLPLGIVSLESRFGSHGTVIFPHEGFNRRSSTACAASCPRPPACQVSR